MKIIKYGNKTENYIIEFTEEEINSIYYALFYEGEDKNLEEEFTELRIRIEKRIERNWYGTDNK